MECLDIRPRLPSGLSEDLDLIAEMSADFARSRDIEATLKLALGRICQLVDAEAASVFMLEGDELVCRACWGPVDVTGLRLPANHGIVGRTVAENAAQIVRDTGHDRDFSKAVDQTTGFVTRSILCAPLSVHDQRLGAIELFNKRSGGGFDLADRRLLVALTASAALAVFNARLAAGMAEQEALKRELSLAAEIQRTMLPAPPGPTFPIHGVNLPARGVSGDFFDVLPLGSDRIAFAIGDVSGKGINASLLMAKTASLFRCLAKRIEGPGSLLAAIDSELAETAAGGMFVTMVAGVLDRPSGTVTLANAGHEPPLLVAPGGTKAIEASMPPLGILPELFADGCPETEVRLGGGTLYLFTDGLTEAESGDGEQLGSAGVEKLLRRHADLPAHRRLEALVGALASGGALRDDATLLAVEDQR